MSVFENVPVGATFGRSAGDAATAGPGVDPVGQPPNRIVALGIALVPEGRRLFKSQSVSENLIPGGQVAWPGPWSLKAVHDLFGAISE